MVIFLLVGTGIIAGLLSGLLGIGGGIIVVPVLAYLLSLQLGESSPVIMQVAIGTSLCIMVFTSQSSARMYMKQGDVRWPLFFSMLPGMMIGAIVGAVMADILHADFLRTFFGIFLLFTAVKFFISRTEMESHPLPPKGRLNLFSGAIGTISSMLGIGGGTLTLSYLTRFALPMRQIIALSTLFTLTVALIGTVISMITGYNVAGLPKWSTGYIAWPAVMAIAIPSMLAAPIGVRLANVVSVYLLKRIFAVFLLITGIDMLWN